MNIDAAELGHKPICASRGHPSEHKAIDAFFAPAADDVITLANLFDERRNVIGIVLQISIHRNDVFAGGVIETRCKRGSLTEVSSQLYHRDAAVDRCNFTQQMKGKIRASIV